MPPRKSIPQQQPEPVVACVVNDNTWNAFTDTAGLERVNWSDEAIAMLCARKDVRAVLVEAELDGHGAEYHDLHGLSLARELRVKHQMRWPMVVTSALPLDYYIAELNGTNVDENMRVLLGSGTGFLPLSELSVASMAKALVGASALDSAELIDINLTLLEERGYLLFLLDHDIKEGDASIRKPLVDRLITGTSTLGIQIKKEHVKGLVSGRNGVFEAAKDAVRHQIEAATRQRNAGGSSVGSGSRPTVLLVEDNPEHMKKICNVLEGAHYQVIPFGRSEDALEHIKKDTSYSIVAVIADWRLKETDGRWQRMQGHKLLDEIATMHPAPLFALSSIDEFYMHVLHGHMNSRPALWRKSHFDAHPDALLDQLQQAIRAHVLDVSGYPDCKRWSEHYRPQYVALRHGPEWPVFNAEIAKGAKALLDEARDQIERQISNNTAAHLLLLNGIMYDDLGLALGGRTGPLKDFLILRRYFFGLFFYLANRAGGIEPPAIYQHTGRLDKASSAKLDLAAWVATMLFKMDDRQNVEMVKGKVKNMINTAMGIKPGELPSRGLLREERSWLTEVGVPADFNAF